MNWVKNQLGTVITVTCLIAAVAAGWGYFDAQQDRLCQQIELKADREPLYRELDQIQAKLDWIIERTDYKAGRGQNL